MTFFYFALCFIIVAAFLAGLLHQLSIMLLVLTFAVILAAYRKGPSAALITTLTSSLIALLVLAYAAGSGNSIAASERIRLAIFIVNGILCSRLFVRLSAAEPLENKGAADRQKQTEAALAESQIRFSGILDSAMDAIITLDEDQRIVLFNPAAERMFRCSREEVIGTPVDRFIPESLRAAHRAHVEHFSATGDTARAMGHLRPLSALRGDGEQFPIEASISQVGIEGRKLFTVILRDITQRQQVEEALHQAKEAAEAANHAKDRFLAVLSHELRTPLTPVIAALSLLEQDKSVSFDTQETLSMVRRNVELEARLIDDLLDVTRIIRGKVDLERLPVQVADIISRSVSVCAPDLDTRQIHFAVSRVDERLKVLGDNVRLQQVVWNVLQNAVKFTPVNGCIGIRCSKENHHALIEVMDSGVGIQPDALERIFKPFEQMDTQTSKRYGLGLGLTIAKAIVEMHGGTIGAFSQGQGRGSVFKIRLPLAAEEAAHEVEPVDESTTVQLPKDGIRPLKILLVEDHRDTARMLGIILRAAGHQVQTAHDVATALSLARADNYDLLISDIGLPDGSGVDILVELRREGQQLPGIALTGFGMEEDIRKTRSAGFAEHIIKPVNVDRLESAVSRATRH